MSIISKETFEKFSEEEKKKVRKLYDTPLKTEVNNWYPGRFVELEVLFDKENLQSKPKIKTWQDVEKSNPEHFSRSNTPNPILIQSAELRDKLLKKTIATYKIAALIELAYGGMITDDEWKDDTFKYCITRRCLELQTSCTISDYEFISFHTPEQRDEFMSYPENVELVEQYHMI